MSSPMPQANSLPFGKKKAFSIGAVDPSTIFVNYRIHYVRIPLSLDYLSPFGKDVVEASHRTYRGHLRIKLDDMQLNRNR